MSPSHNLFASKLNELESEYAQMLARIQTCCEGTQEEIVQAKQALWEEYRAQETRLSEVISGGRSKAVTELSTLQLRYFQQLRSILEEKLPQYLDATSPPTDGSRAEAMALYAEFTIDNAIQSMRYALHAVFSSVELQMHTEGPQES